MATMIQVGDDVVTFLKAQHRQVKALFEQVVAARGELRTKEFYGLRRMMAIHETAEEAIVHPAARKALPDGERIVEARLSEERAAKEVLSRLEAMDVDSPEFDTLLRGLQTSVIEHAESEEREEFVRLAGSFDAAKLARMRKAVEIAEAVAPTRPHAGVESAMANMLAGPFASMVDRTRDALEGKR